MQTGLLIGRFQPFHLGHLSAVRQALSQCGHLIIGIGSSQYSGTEENPLTAEARGQIIRASLDDEGIAEDRFSMVSIPDIHDNGRWVDHVKGLVPVFDTLFIANDGIVMELFAKHSPNIDIVTLKRELDLSATRVREALKRGEDWRSLVPKAAAPIITKHWPNLS